VYHDTESSKYFVVLKKPSPAWDFLRTACGSPESPKYSVRLKKNRHGPSGWNPAPLTVGELFCLTAWNRSHNMGSWLFCLYMPVCVSLSSLKNCNCPGPAIFTSACNVTPWLLHGCNSESGLWRKIMSCSILIISGTGHMVCHGLVWVSARLGPMPNCVVTTLSQIELLRYRWLKFWESFLWHWGGRGEKKGWGLSTSQTPKRAERARWCAQRGTRKRNPN